MEVRQLEFLFICVRHYTCWCDQDCSSTFQDNLVFFKSFPAKAEIGPLFFIIIKKVMFGGVKPGAVCAPPTNGARSLATPQRAAYPPAPPHMAEPPCPSPLAYCRKSYPPHGGRDWGGFKYVRHNNRRVRKSAWACTICYHVFPPASI